MVPDIVRSTLAEWSTFYVITGSAAAALTGLQFVVMTLVAQVQTKRDMATIDAFGTPTIVHFCAVLLVSAMLTAPWHSPSSVAIALGACGLAGIVYAMFVTRRAFRQTIYKPVMEDWIWHSALPLVAYAGMLVAALVLPGHFAGALFMSAASVVLLMFIGIHNAWDTVTYVAVEQVH